MYSSIHVFTLAGEVMNCMFWDVTPVSPPDPFAMMNLSRFWLAVVALVAVCLMPIVEPTGGEAVTVEVDVVVIWIKCTADKQ